MTTKKLTPTQERIYESLQTGECIDVLINGGYRHRTKPVQHRTYMALISTGDFYLILCHSKLMKRPEGSKLVHRDHLEQYRDTYHVSWTRHMWTTSTPPEKRRG